MEDIIDRARNGDAAAFRHLVETHHAYIRSIAAYMGASVSDADDIAQETFIYAFQHLSQYRKNSNFRGWLAAVARNRTLSHLRDRQRTNQRETLAAAQQLMAQTDPHLFDDALLEKLETCLGALNPDYYDMLQARYRGVPIGDLAKTMNRSEEATRALLMRIRKKLRTCIEGAMMQDETHEDKKQQHHDNLLNMHFHLKEDGQNFVDKVMQTLPQPEHNRAAARFTLWQMIAACTLVAVSSLLIGRNLPASAASPDTFTHPLKPEYTPEITAAEQLPYPRHAIERTYKLQQMNALLQQQN